MPDYIIRKVMSSDLEGVYSVFNQADLLHRQAHPEIFQKADDPELIKDFLFNKIQSQETITFVAESNGSIIGAVMAFIYQTPEAPIMVERTYLSVNNIVVDKAFRGKGIGQALMERVHAWAKQQDIKYVHLTVWEFNQEAIAFYHHLGYQFLHHRMRKVLS